MSEKKTVLVPGGTGAMGVYLVPELLKLGYKVDVVSLDDCNSDNPDLRYFKANFKKPSVREEFLKNRYDAIVDFMVYTTQGFRDVHRELLSNCGHYIYLSSYRVYAGDERPIREDSPRLLDSHSVSHDTEFLASEDYSLYKARGENILRESGFSNWTAVRPAITFSQRRFQLTILEADVIVHRAKHGKTVLLPEDAMHVQATMSWAGDVARMIARLVLNSEALREVYSVCTAEHQSWKTIAEYYRELIGLDYITVSKEDFLSCMSPDNAPQPRRQLDYDRLIDRVMDNSKILAVTGLKQAELTTVYDGLKRELSALPPDAFTADTSVRNSLMDKYLAEHRRG
ncbi:MAG: NAD-dependent epimerase/dehydratase family protein [Eubacteriales bacterium]|nr:NAD-dependent epimerase/dehydratase family protein [Eubacteriales bacterium]